ncbi:peroxiredoxin-like family protein [uncultured Ruegeria sp.]|uniref:peroxiredoxin-like family protein n=1 Tax=uncultured Ruegeria sp. TaxID=259304 RepID=UPI002607AEED|nr:peroxiredoxin-like family protein [uncultured Ruegeria sp.]
MTSPKPAVGKAFPAINIPVLGGRTRSLSTPRDGYDWMLTVVYRGKHCPLCTTYLRDLNSALPDLNALGVDVLAVSADSAERATAQMQEVSPTFDIGYGLSVEQMQTLGLYISGPRNGMDVEGPFAEPGLFVINDQGVLQIVDISNVPFARPSLTSLVMGIRFLRGLSGDFPVNGTHA